MLAELAVATAAFKTVKSFISEGKELYDMGEQLYSYFDAKSSLQKAVNKSNKSDKSDLEEFLALEKLKAQEDELRELMIYTGRPGMWTDWLKFQSAAAQRREEERKEEQRKKIKFQQDLYNYFEIGVVVCLIVGTVIGVGWFVYMLKFARLKQLGIELEDAKVFDTVTSSTTHGTQMQFVRMHLEDRKAIPKLFKDFKFDMVCNLAAQAGVRYSLENPEAYVDSNITGFLNILECCRHNSIKRLIYASSSSIYGNSDKVPFNESDNVDKPISLYAATKKSNELMAHTYSHLYDIEIIGLRFFTVYGPWGRPDMAMFLFTDAIINSKPIKVFNNGELYRDFTYIDDIVAGVLATLLENSNDKLLYKLYNIGNSSPVKLMNFIKFIENSLGVVAEKEMLPMQAGDVQQTWADVSRLQEDYHYKPNTSVEKGVEAFIDWYKMYYKIK